MSEISAAQSRVDSLSRLGNIKDVLYNAKTQSYGLNNKSYGIIEFLTGAITFKALFFSDPAKQADRKATANQIVKDLSQVYDLDQKSINTLSTSLLNQSEGFSKPISSGLVKSIAFQAIKQAIKQAGAEEVEAKQQQQVEQTCPDKDLAAALFNNQFRRLTIADKKIQSGSDDITQLSRQLRGTYNLKNPSQKAKADAIFNARLKSLSQPATPEYDAVTPEKLAAYHELGQMTAHFKSDVLPTLQRRNNQATGAPSVDPTSIVQSSRIKISQGKESSQNPEEKAFDTAVKNFLDQNRNVTKEGLQAFFERYKSRIA